MKSILIILAGFLLCSAAGAIPPVAGDFMTGPNSAVYVIWFHPEINYYRQGLNQVGPTYPICGGGESGDYAVAQRVALPYGSYLTDFSVKIYPPNQFTPFRYAIFAEGPDSMPLQPAAMIGENTLCGGSPCPDVWVTNQACIFDPAGQPLWLGFIWEFDPPSAPEIVALPVPDAFQFNLLGVGQSGIYSWTELNYAPWFDLSFMAAFPCDTMISMGWRRSVVAADHPDSFLIESTDESSNTTTSMTNSPDTLICRLGYGAIHSVLIRSCYGSQAEEKGLTLPFDSSRVLPISVATALVSHNALSRQYQFDVALRNEASQPLALTVGYDSRWAELPAHIIAEPGMTVFPAAISVPDSVTGDWSMPILLCDGDNHYYPFMLRLSCPSSGQTGADEDEPVATEPASIIAYPNPYRGEGPLLLKVGGSLSNANVYNILGERISGAITTSDGLVIWDGRQATGGQVPSGVYIIRAFDGSGQAVTRAILLLR